MTGVSVAVVVGAGVARVGGDSGPLTLRGEREGMDIESSRK